MKTFKTTMAFLTAMTMTMGAMSVTAFADESTVADVAVVSTNEAKYDIDAADYKAKIDSLGESIPLEELVLRSLNKTVDNEFLNPVSFEDKWYYKHVFAGQEGLEIARHTPELEGVANNITAESLQLVAEQGRADEIEDKDGKVRKFNKIDIIWSILLSDNELNADDVNAFLSENELNSHVVKTTNDGKQFALHFDNEFTTEEVLNTLTALNEKFGIIPGVIANEVGTYALYHDSAYTGSTTADTWSVFDVKNNTQKSDNTNSPITENDAVLSQGVEYHYNPETGVMVFDGNGVLTAQDIANIWAGRIFDGRQVAILGKDVKFASAEPEKEINFSEPLGMLTCNIGFSVFGYKDSSADTEFKLMVDILEERDKKQLAETGVEANSAKIATLNILDDGVDPYDVLSGAVDLGVSKRIPTFDEIIQMKQQGDISEEKEQMTALKGDADLNGEIGIADVIKVSKHNINSTAYPLANETAEANADMNNDNVVDGLDTSALVEYNLGKK